MFDPTAAFDKLVKQVLWPAFKALGYKKSGHNFRYHGATGWGKLVQLQKSPYNSAAELRFTVNTGLYLPEVDYYLCAQQAKPSFSEPACVVRQHLGQLKGNRPAEWYSLTATTDPAPLFALVASDFQQYVHPYLASITSRADIYALLVGGHRSHYLPAQIQAMHQAGYQAAALALFTSELARAKADSPYRATLRQLALALELPPELWLA